MRPNVDFRECLKDSPKFRASVEDAEQDLDLLEVKLEKLMKLCTAMIESGKVHNSANSLFILGLKEVAIQFNDDQLTTGKSSVSEALRRFTHVLTELQKFHTILLDQAQRSIVQSLGNFIKRDIRKVKETRKHFDKISNDLDAVLVKNSQASRNKPHECEEANNIVLATKSGFLHTALDYVFQLNVIHSKKNFDILDTVLAYLHAQNAYFHQGSDLFTDLEAYMKQVASQVEDLSTAAERDRKEMENRHLLVQQKAFSEVQSNEDPGVNVNQDLQNPVVPSSDPEDEVKMEGYLFKRTSNTFKTWVRRWFQIHDNQLVYRKRSKDSITVMEDDLRLCTVRPSFDLDRRFCFEVVSPARSHILQADSENECTKWIRAIQDGVSMAYNNRKSQDTTDDKDDSYEAKDGSDTAGDQDSSSGVSDTSTSRPRNAGISGAKSSSMCRIQSAILQVPGNSLCCDCGASNPSWASINLGITLCIECSGIHRSLGVHISKVRSLTLDAWEVGLVRVMVELGNAVVNQIYEAKVDESVAAKPNASSTRAVREAWIKAKYVTKSFTKQIPIPKPDSPPSHVARRWSVCKRKKKASAKGGPDQKVSPANTGLAELPEGDVKLTGDSAIDLSQDNAATADVFIFGLNVNCSEHWNQININLDESGLESGSDSEKDPDVSLTTSLEDISKLHPDMLLYKAARARNLPVMSEAIAFGASLNWQNEEDLGRTALIQAVLSGSMTTVEFLLLNGAKVDICDVHSQTPLHHATILGHTGLVCQFLKRSANHQLMDDNGKNSLTIAMETANADIVTLLRLAQLNEEMKEHEGGYSLQDETVNEVFRDFTNMANSAPEKLNRNK